MAAPAQDDPEFTGTHCPLDKDAPVSAHKDAPVSALRQGYLLGIKTRLCFSWIASPIRADLICDRHDRVSRLLRLDHAPERKIDAAVDRRRGLWHLMEPEALKSRRPL